MEEALRPAVRFSVAILLLLSTSGCVAAVVGASMAANLAASEAFTSGMNPEVELTGIEVYQMAKWDERVDEDIPMIFGRTDWSCARGQPGTKICVPIEEATEANVTEEAIFGCSYGTGGMVSNAVAGNTTTLFCIRRS